MMVASTGNARFLSIKKARCEAPADCDMLVVHFGTAKRLYQDVNWETTALCTQYSSHGSRHPRHCPYSVLLGQILSLWLFGRHAFLLPVSNHNPSNRKTCE
jgi:hypothetical protein